MQEETGTKENENAQSIEVVLNEMSRKNQSLIIHSGLFDKSVHYASQRLNRETAALNFLFGDGKNECVIPHFQENSRILWIRTQSIC